MCSGRVRNFGLSAATASRRAGSWERTNWDCAESGPASFALEAEDGEVKLRPRDAAAGWEVRKESDGGAWREALRSDGGGERRDVSCEIRDAFWACVLRRARLSFLVSCTLRRRVTIDSGVGASGGSGRLRP